MKTLAKHWTERCHEIRLSGNDKNCFRDMTVLYAFLINTLRYKIYFVIRIHQQIPLSKHECNMLIGLWEKTFVF